MREHDDVEAALAAALRPRGVNDAAARAALAAFRTARDAGLHGSRRTRRREDWRPVPERGTGRSLKTALAALAASLTLGGVAFAAAATHEPHDDTENRAPEASRGAPVPLPPRWPVIPPSASPDPIPPAAPRGASTPPGAPHHAAHPPGSGEALCHAYGKSLGKGGRAMEAAARERLVAAADGKDVAAYCDSLQAAAEVSGQGHAAARPSSGTHAKPEAGPSVHRLSAPAGDATADGQAR
ncbi:hypothetical protein [Streptomyces sp. R44]|uniref:Uncharacterized protein n=1 Tax=Streptomyces sp. R44 TaxID=3238633 RepID=A0AB39SZD3_9ACTN